MRRRIEKTAVHVGYQPQLPSGGQQAFSFPLFDLSLIKKPLDEGLFFCGRPPLAVTLRAACRLRRLSVYRASNRWEKI
ncbi:hypothetical protein ABRZ24_08300 [Brenneria populi]|uniref:Uncharacterized protein n=1 Tax=Brenneria populi TaxID=1505588 RepID=A0ABU6JPU4_9GAMM|nr:hypothetical protein [Brenneria populi Li et al. 2015]